MDLRPKCFLRRPFQEQKDYYRSGDLIIGGNLPLSLTKFLQLPLHEPPVLLWTLPAVVQMDLRPKCFLRRPFQEQKDYYRSGDLIIGGNLPLSLTKFLQLPLHEPPGIRASSPIFYQIDPQYHLQNEAIVQLLLYFQWNWIGIVVENSESSEHFIWIFDATLAQHDICIQFQISLSFQTKPFSRCVKRCLPGQARKVEEKKCSCCYGCVSCPEGTISNETGKLLEETFQQE
ncbi:hypothetical protein E2320_022104 [Naja naja]|nr:hypothetical protein E2320_022104 [Naja naja]